MHNFVYLAQRHSQEFSCEPNFGGGAACPRPPGRATAADTANLNVNAPCRLDQLGWSRPVTSSRWCCRSSPEVPSPPRTFCSRPATSATPVLPAYRATNDICRRSTCGTWLTELWFYKLGHFGDVSPSKSLGLVWKELNLAQQKHASTVKGNVLQHKINTKTKAGFSRCLRHPAWKRNGSILKGKDK